MRSEGEVFMIVLFFLALVVGIGIGAAQISEGSLHDSCHSDGKLINQKVTYRMWDGCYVNQNDKWIPLEVWTWNRNNNVDMSKIGQ